MYVDIHEEFWAIVTQDKKVYFYGNPQQELVTAAAAASRASLDSEQQVDTRQQREGPMGVNRE